MLIYRQKIWLCRIRRISLCFELFTRTQVQQETKRSHFNPPPVDNPLKPLEILIASLIHFFFFSPPSCLAAHLLYLWSDKTKIKMFQNSNRQGPAFIPASPIRRREGTWTLFTVVFKFATHRWPFFFKLIEGRRSTYSQVDGWSVCI